MQLECRFCTYKGRFIKQADPLQSQKNWHSFHWSIIVVQQLVFLRVKGPWFLSPFWPRDLGYCKMPVLFDISFRIDGCFFFCFWKQLIQKSTLGLQFSPSSWKFPKQILQNLSCKRSDLQMVKSHVSWAMVILLEDFSNRSCYNGQIRRLRDKKWSVKTSKTIILQPVENLCKDFAKLFFSVVFHERNFASMIVSCWWVLDS